MKQLTQQNHPLYVGRGSLDAFGKWISQSSYAQIAVLADENTGLSCYPVLRPFLPSGHELITIPAGEPGKQLATCEKVWEKLNSFGFQRKDLLICLGGGVVTDLGAFVASVYLRGISFVQIPTSLLAMVDAGIGGKTGVDFGYHKNRIGTFAFPVCTVCDPVFLDSLPEREWREGSAEIYKHAVIADSILWDLLAETPVYPDLRDDVLERAVKVKLGVVHEDPLEKGRRKVLNFGHTIGHAYESYRLSTGSAVSHGYAVALGMQVEAHLALCSGWLSREAYDEISRGLIKAFGTADLNGVLCSALLHWMRFDKKNSEAGISFSLPDAIGSCVWDRFPDTEVVRQSLLTFNALEG